jgi:hypothetical protein
MPFDGVLVRRTAHDPVHVAGNRLDVLAADVNPVTRAVREGIGLYRKRDDCWKLLESVGYDGVSLAVLRNSGHDRD